MPVSLHFQLGSPAGTWKILARVQCYLQPVTLETDDPLVVYGIILTKYMYGSSTWTSPFRCADRRQDALEEGVVMREDGRGKVMGKKVGLIGKFDSDPDGVMGMEGALLATQATYRLLPIRPRAGLKNPKKP
ncbi:hypothetical protein NLI96_g12428 [Meripilus lineatus]|uniref:Uncharacterized protein n=1 Tax=Meripilus lineatus TaxID=2056292 RepID=A0AAD5Y7L3_9APHY|nr:hypothetical protein NLI96_g12428 [Physisporinus lineatus]